MWGKRVGIDLGTANVLVYVKDRGIVINEPSVVAIAPRENRIVAVGNQAREMLGRTPESIQVIRPMRDGVIADYIVTEAMLRYFIGKVLGGFNLFRPEVMICIPVGATSVEQRAVQEAAEQARARRPAHLVPEPLAAALGAQMPVDSPRGNMVVDIGGGRTEAAVISMYGIVVSQSLRVAGDKLNDAIAAFIKRKHNLIVGDRSAEEVKMEIGSALPLEEERSMEVRGRDQVSGLPKTIEVTSTEVTQAIAEPLSLIVATIKGVLERTPPELAADIIDRGVVITGGGAQLPHVAELFMEETGVPCQVAEEPLNCVALGAGLALEHLDDIKRSLPIEDALTSSRL
jgi:rod shape-determining protein MreB